MVRPSTDLHLVGERLILMECGEVFVPESFSSSKKKMQRAGLVWTRRGSLNPEVAPSLGGFCPIPIRTLLSYLPWRTSEFSTQTRSNFKLGVAIFIIRQECLAAQFQSKIPSFIHLFFGKLPSPPRRMITNAVSGSKASDFLIHRIFSQKTRPREPPPLNTIDMNADLLSQN